MIAQSAFNASKERAAELLISRGYEPVLPGREQFPLALYPAPPYRASG